MYRSPVGGLLPLSTELTILGWARPPGKESRRAHQVRACSSNGLFSTPPSMHSPVVVRVVPPGLPPVKDGPVGSELPLVGEGGRNLEEVPGRGEELVGEGDDLPPESFRG